MMRWRILVAAVCTACADRDAGSPRAAASSPGCEAATSGSLALAPSPVLRRQSTQIPAALVALPTGAVLTVDGKTAGVDLYAWKGADTRLIAAPEPLRVLTRAGTGVLAAGAHGIYRVDPERHAVEWVRDAPLRAGEIVSLASDGRTVWVVGVSQTTSSAELLATTLDSAGTWVRRPLDRPVRLEPLGQGRVAAAAVAAPHTLWIFDSALAVNGSVTPGGSRLVVRGNSDAALTQALTLLDCGRLLQVVADMRSDRRRFHLYSISGKATLVRSRAAELRMGIAHSIPQERRLVAVYDGPGWWEASWLEWTWEHQ